MSDPTTAPFSTVRLADVVTDAGPPDGSGAAAFHLVRRHFDVQAFGVNGATGNAGELVITEHDERDDTDYGTEGHEEGEDTREDRSEVGDERCDERDECNCEGKR